MDIRAISIIKDILIPQESSSPISKEIISNAISLLDLEKEYLERETVLAANIIAAKQQKESADSWLEELKVRVSEHNKQAARLMANIDYLFFREFELNESEIEIINKGLETIKLAVFEYSRLEVIAKA